MAALTVTDYQNKSIDLVKKLLGTPDPAHPNVRTGGIYNGEVPQEVIDKWKDNAQAATTAEGVQDAIKPILQILVTRHPPAPGHAGAATAVEIACDNFFAGSSDKRKIFLGDDFPAPDDRDSFLNRASNNTTGAIKDALTDKQTMGVGITALVAILAARQGGFWGYAMAILGGLGAVELANGKGVKAIAKDAEEGVATIGQTALSAIRDVWKKPTLGPAVP